MSKEKLLELSKKAEGLELLYVEDNKGLQQQAVKIFEKIFQNVTACDTAEEALLSFKKNQPQIVISDISMAKLNGLEMAKIMKKIEPFTKIIITSAYDDKEYLFEAIDTNVSKFLKKPISIVNLIEAIEKVTDEIHFEKNKDLFEHYIKDAFQYQDTMLILIKEEEVLIVNKKCLEFFSQESTESFKEFFVNFDEMLLKHNSFLYNHDNVDWLKSVKENSGKLFNVKIADKENNSRHFILKAYKIPDKENVFILSFDDITELNLLVIYDKNAMQQEKHENQKKIIYNILEVIKRNKSSIKIYSSYKGLIISNTGVLEYISEDYFIIQTPYMQLRAIKINNSLTIESELFPIAVLCDVKKVDFESGQVFVKKYRFIEDMPSQREFIRVEPEENHKITIFYESCKILADVRIVDISVEGAKVVLSLLPAGLKAEDEIVVDIVFKSGAKPLIINVKARVKVLTELKREFEMLLFFEHDSKVKKLLTEYVANRQMALIREFKKL